MASDQGGVPAGGRSGDATAQDTAYDVSTSADYVQADDKLEWALGYPFALRALGVGGTAPPETLLDYGCGPGQVAERVARRYGLRVVAVDASDGMLTTAAERYAHPSVTYRRVRENRLGFLDEASVDAAMSCFVFLVLPSRDQLLAISREIRRVLRPGGRFVILDPDPRHVGVQFSTFRTGEPGVTYQDGDPRPARLLLSDGSWLDLQDYFWSTRTYEDVLDEAGFVDVRTEIPLLDDAEHLADPDDLTAWDYRVERVHPPFVLVHGQRPAM